MRQPTVFLVDAFRDECDMYAEYLGLSGFAVSTFDSADAALEDARIAAPDVIVTRIRQTKGIDGITLTGIVRGDPAIGHVPIVVITASMLPAEHDAAVRAGCDACLLLPITPDDLAIALRSLLQARPSRA